MKRRKFLKTAILAIVGAVLGKGAVEVVEPEMMHVKFTEAETAHEWTSNGGYVVPSEFADYLREAYNESVVSRRIMSFKREVTMGTPVDPNVVLRGVCAKWYEEDEVIPWKP